MRPSSYLIVILVIVAFVAIQGWIVSQKFLAPKRLTTSEGVILGVQTDVGTPVSGLITEVAVVENQRVVKGQRLFTVLPLSPTQPSGGAPVAITAKQSGIVTDLRAPLGSYTKADQNLARIVDRTIESLYVRANLPIDPEDLPMLHPPMRATVQARYLSGGKPVAAILTSVDPVYDAREQAIGVRLRFLELPSGLLRLSLGVPVTVSIDVENSSRFRGFLQRIAKGGVIPFSRAQQQ